jgi:hypothetical protein
MKFDNIDKVNSSLAHACYKNLNFNLGSLEASIHDKNLQQLNSYLRTAS